MRARGPLAAIAAAAAAALGLSGCATSAVTVDPLARAATATAHGGVHMQLSAHVQAASLPEGMTMSGKGFFNYSTREGDISLTLEGLPPEAGIGSSAVVHELYKGSQLYLASSLFAGKLPGGATWMRVDLARAGQAAGVDPAQLLGGQSNPAQLLE